MKTQIITLATLLATTACGGLDESDAELQPSAALTSTPRECAADRVYFAGQCRAVTYFERRASAGVTFVGVSGSRRIPVCPAGATCAASEVTLFEERTGEVAAIRVTDDANVAAGMGSATPAAIASSPRSGTAPCRPPASRTHSPSRSSPPAGSGLAPRS